MAFRDREDAGKRLAEQLKHLEHEDVVVLGLPRGGVPVAFEVARALGAPLDIIVVRKLGVPFQPEFAMGAIGEGGACIVNSEVLRAARIDQAELVAVERRERVELERRVQRFRGHRARLSLVGRVAVVIDDGIATGSTARAACQVARVQGAARVVLAVPVAPRRSIAELAGVADEVVCLEAPEYFLAVGEWYRDFSQTSDEQVVQLLDRAAGMRTPEMEILEDDADPPARDEEVKVRAGHIHLGGHLIVPEVSRGLVVFSHGSGSSRHSPRNRFVASVLNEAGFGTLLFDLLTPDEEYVRAHVFDIDLLADRLQRATNWLRSQPEADRAPIGYFGASTGAAAALRAAGRQGAEIEAVVSRGGRPDLAGPVLADVRAPTLLIVGGKDTAVLELNRQAQTHLHCENELVVVPGATHLFEEPGTLEEAAGLARDWFVRHLARASLAAS